MLVCFFCRITVDKLMTRCWTYFGHNRQAIWLEGSYLKWNKKRITNDVFIFRISFIETKCLFPESKWWLKPDIQRQGSRKRVTAQGEGVDRKGRQETGWQLWIDSLPLAQLHRGRTSARERRHLHIKRNPPCACQITLLPIPRPQPSQLT